MVMSRPARPRTKSTESAESNRRQKVQAAEFSVLVLRKLAEIGGASSLGPLAEALETHPAKLHRYLASLKNSGLVYQEQISGRYILAHEAIMIGLAAMRQADVLTLSLPELKALTEKHKVSCFIAIPGNAGPTIMKWEDPVHAVVVNVRPGSVMPILWSATGRVYAAFHTSPEVGAMIRQELKNASPAQRAFLNSMKSVTAMLAEIRTNGCASISDVMLPGISAHAAPIFDHGKKLAGVLTVLGTSGQIDPNPHGALARDLIDRANDISSRLGFHEA